MDEIDIYGTNTYSDDSALCLAAFHAGALDPIGGNFVVIVEKPSHSYEPSMQNGVYSKSKDGDPAGKAVSFEKT